MTTRAGTAPIDDVRRRRTRLARLLRAGVALAVVWRLLAPLAAGAETETVVIPAQRDTTIMEAHPRDNDGSWGFLWLKWNSERGFENRVLLGFDLSPLAGRAADVVAARIVLRAADHSFPRRGTGLSTYFVDPAATPWSEGTRQFDTFSYCGRRDLFRPPTGEGGPGATWSCEDDLGALDPLGGPSCGPSGGDAPWRGGLLPPLAATPPRGSRSTASATQVETKGYDPLCRRAFTCFAESASPDCWRTVTIEVGADVREALGQGFHAASWLLKKDRVEAGAARFFSREGAVCRLGLPELRPRLEVTLAGDGHPPVIVPEPPLDCGG